jgi:hypothetical protein
MGEVGELLSLREVACSVGVGPGPLIGLRDADGASGSFEVGSGDAGGAFVGGGVEDEAAMEAAAGREEVEEVVGLFADEREDGVVSEMECAAEGGVRDEGTGGPAGGEYELQGREVERADRGFGGVRIGVGGDQAVVDAQVEGEEGGAAPVAQVGVDAEEVRVQGPGFGCWEHDEGVAILAVDGAFLADGGVDVPAGAGSDGCFVEDARGVAGSEAQRDGELGVRRGERRGVAGGSCGDETSPAQGFL